MFMGGLEVLRQRIAVMFDAHSIDVWYFRTPEISDHHLGKTGTKSMKSSLEMLSQTLN